MKYEDELQQYTSELSDDFIASRLQREMSQEEMRFAVVPGAQWEGDLGDAYHNRAKMEVDMVSDHASRVYGEWCDNRTTVSYSADDGATTDEDARLMDGLYKRTLRRKGGGVAIDTAVKEAIHCGFGAYIFNVNYEDEGDPDNEYQDIVISEQPEAYATVFFDTASRRADKADARRATVLTPYRRDDLDYYFPEKVVTDLNKLTKPFDWDVGADLIYVATRYHKEKKSIRVNKYSHPQKDPNDPQNIVTLEGDDIKKDEDYIKSEGYELIRSKLCKLEYIYKTVFSGSEILEPTRKIAGKYLPVIPIYGYRGFMDGKEYYHGVIRKRMDAQRTLNMAYSLAAEGAAYAGQRKPILLADQVTSMAAKESWSKSPHETPYRLVEEVRDGNGNIVTSILGYDDGAQLSQAAISMIEMASLNIQQGTGGAPQEVLDQNSSGKAINAIIKRVDRNVSFIFDNINQSLKHSGYVYRALASDVYGSDANIGRDLKIIDQRDNTTSIKLLSKGFTPDGVQTVNDPSKGKYEVIATVSKGYETQSEETVDALKDLLPHVQNDQQLGQFVLSEIIRLLPNGDLEDIKSIVRQRQLASGAKPRTEEEAQIVQQIQQAQGNQEEDPQQALLKSMAAEQQTQAAMNAARIKKTEMETLKTGAQARQIEADTEIKLKQYRQAYYQ